MAREIVNLGTGANDGTGDPLRTAFEKINNNFSELYSETAADSQISFSGNKISANASNADLVLEASGTGAVQLGALKVVGTTINSDDSTQVTIAENLHVTGNITGTFTGDGSSLTGITATALSTPATVDNLILNDNIISSASNADINITPGGTGSVNIMALTIDGTEISSSDSTQVTIKENLNVTGDVRATAFYGDGSNLSGISADSIGDLTVTGSTISAPSNADLTLNAGGTGSVDIEGIQIKGTEISSTDSTQVTIKENLHVTGNITGTLTGSVAFANVTSTPTTLAGYGITDAASSTATALTVVGDDSTGTAVTLGESFKVAGATGVTTAVSGDTLTITGPDLTSYITASSSDTLTNKTIDANGTGNSISNIEVADFAAASIVSAAEGVGSNNNDTTIPTSAAVKAYADSVGGGSTGDLTITGSTISAPSNADLTLTNSGTGNVVFDSWRFRDNTLEGHRSNEHLNIKTNGTGTLTLESAGSIVIDANTVSLNATLHVGAGGDQAGGVLIEDNTIKTARSNENIELLPNGTGSVHVLTSLKLASGATVTGILDEDNMSTNSATQLATQQSIKAYVDAEISGVSGGSTGDLTITGSTISAPSNADLTLNAGGTGSVDIEGIQIKGTEISSTDSTQVTIKENLHVTGNITGTLTGSVAFANVTSTPTTLAGYGITDAASATATAITVVGDDSTGTAVTLGESFKIAGTQNVTTAVSGDTLTVTGPDLTSYVTASSSTTFTNKTFDVEGTGNSISNIDVADLKSGVLDTDLSSVSGSDDTLASAKAIKAYVDANSGGSTGDLTITGSTISSPSNAPLTLDPSGSGKVTAVGGLVVSGGDTETADITSSGQIDAVGFTSTGSSTFDGVQITDNTITSATSNADLQINASGTGTIVLENLKIGTSGSTVTTILDEDNMSSNSDTALATQQSIKAYVDSEISGVSGASTGDITFTGSTIQSPSNADITLDPAGTGGVVAQGPVTFNAGYIEKINSLTSSSTITVDCSAASIHTVTLGTSTEFNITNLPTGGSVTLIITQDGTGGRTATFGTDGSSAVKFPSNSSTLSTGAADIDVVTIVNDGTNFLGNIAKDYRSS